MIGYYIHHHGRGHLARAGAVAAACREPVVALSSLPAPAAHPFADWVTLAPDPALPDPDDPTAGGTLHWAPLDSPRYRARMRTLADWVATAAPRLVHVDVSVEVAALVRLIGTPVTVSAMPGARDDRAHALAYSMASLIIAAWPADVPVAQALQEHAHKLRHVGAVSRFDGRARVAPHAGRVLVLLGAGGTTAADDLDAVLQRAGWDARVLGGASGWSDDPWTELCAAEVVVTNAGQNAVAEVAAAARPAVVVPESRPFGEQHATAALLAADDLALVVPGWPVAAQWPALLERARHRDGGDWRRWNDGGGAERFARALEDAA